MCILLYYWANKMKMKKNDDDCAPSGYLQDHFDGEDACKDVVEIVEHEVAERVLEYGIFGGQGDAAGTDDDHYEEVEVAQVHDEVTEPTNSAESGSKISLLVVVTRLAAVTVCV